MQKINVYCSSDIVARILAISLLEKKVQMKYLMGIQDVSNKFSIPEIYLLFTIVKCFESNEVLATLLSCQGDIFRRF